MDGPKSRVSSLRVAARGSASPSPPPNSVPSPGPLRTQYRQTQRKPAMSEWSDSLTRVVNTHHSLHAGLWQWRADMHAHAHAYRVVTSARTQLALTELRAAGEVPATRPHHPAAKVDVRGTCMHTGSAAALAHRRFSH